MKRILVVDDSPTIRKAIRKILESAGHVVSEAEDGADALCQLGGGGGAQFDAVLCDIDMPVMDGLTFLEQAKPIPGTKPPIIMCTTHNTFEKIQRALMLGASEYIMKPFDAEIIESKLKACGVL
jgi:two-component system chemotaxis response regulator CheY